MEKKGKLDRGKLLAVLTDMGYDVTFDSKTPGLVEIQADGSETMKSFDELKNELVEVGLID